MTVELLIRAIFIYYIALHGLYLFLMLLGASQHRRYQQGINFGEFRRISESPLSLPVSVVMPAYNEERNILRVIEDLATIDRCTSASAHRLGLGAHSPAP